MKLRWKLLSLIAFFFIGSFLLVGWRAQNVLGQQYNQEIVKKEIQNVEQLGSFMDERLSGLEFALEEGRNVKSILSYYDVKLLAYTLKTEGRWRARWYAGENGFRSQARDVMKQIPLKKLPIKRKTWHRIRYKGTKSGFAYVVPQKKSGQISYYIFFLGDQFFAKALASSGSYSVFSPFVGELFSSSESVGFSHLYKTHKDKIDANLQGWVPLSKQKNLIYLFQPDLQLYILKTANVPSLQSNLGSMFWILGALVFLLGAIVILGVDYFMRGMFERIHRLTDSMLRLGSEEEQPITIISEDELSALEFAHNMLVKKDVNSFSPVTDTSSLEIIDDIRQPINETTSAEYSDTSELLDEIRPMTINAIGHLHKMKESGEGEPNAHVKSMETDLREIRRLMDKAESSEQIKVFEPEMSSAAPLNFSNENSQDIKIRRPKREGNELK